MPILAMAMCVNFTSCGDDENEGIINPDAPTKRLTRVVKTYPDSDNSHAYDIGYDGEGRVVSIYEELIGRHCDITYSGNNQAIAQYSSGVSETWTLDERNHVVSVNSGVFPEDDVLLSYNSDGYLIQEKEYEEKVADYYMTDFVYKDGLLLSGDEADFNITYTDIPNVGNICVEIYIYPEWCRHVAYTGLIGNHYRLLPEKMEWDDSVPVITYEYELDADGYVKRVTAKGVSYTGEDYTEILDFTYEEVR